MTKVDENSAALATRNKGCVRCSREGRCPASLAVSGTVPVGLAHLRAELTAAAGNAAGDKQCGAEGALHGS